MSTPTAAPAVRSASVRPTTYTLYGRAFKIEAEYPDDDKGTAAANAFMEEHDGMGVLAVAGGRIVIADCADKGVPA